MRDAVSEAMFFEVYGNVFSLYFSDKRGGVGEAVVEARALPYVKEALAAIDRGGYAEALARAASLLARHGTPLPLSWIEAKKEIMQDYRDLLPDLPPEAWRRVRGEQDIIVRYERERALATMPALLPARADRERLLELMSRLVADERIQATQPTPEQVATLEALRATLSSVLDEPRRAGGAGRARSRARSRSTTKRRREERHGTRAR
jgi:hypothetical protein